MSNSRQDEACPANYFKDGDDIAATIAVMHETPVSRPSFGVEAASYGVALFAQDNRVFPLWGAGYASYPIPMVAFAVARVLREVPEGLGVTAYVPTEFVQYARPREGWARDALRNNGLMKSGKPLDCLPEFARITAALDDGRLKLETYRGKWQAPWWAHAAPAAVSAMQKALAYKQENHRAHSSSDSPLLALEGGT